MTVFITNPETWGSEKINFIDKNNVFVGYDMCQDCCEYFGWYVSDQKSAELPPAAQISPDPERVELDDYNFTGRYFNLSTDNEWQGIEGHLCFELISSTEQVKYLHLFNHHNGYYVHGCEFFAGEKYI